MTFKAVFFESLEEVVDFSALESILIFLSPTLEGTSEDENLLEGTSDEDNLLERASEDDSLLKLAANSDT